MYGHRMFFRDKGESLMQKILIIGARGQLGSDLCKVIEGNLKDATLMATNREELDVTDFEQVRNVLENAGADVVINTSAFHQVDLCEEQWQPAFEVNAYAARHLAQVCTELDTTLVHLSTDYVFGGEENRNVPYSETDRPFPVSVYGASKLAGEYLVRNTCKKHFVIRGSGLYGVAGSAGKGGNFIETMLRLGKEGKLLKVVADQITTPTFTADLAEKIIELIQTERYGLYHISNTDSCSWHQFAAAIFECCGLQVDLSPTTSDAYGAAAKRPSYSVFAHEALHGAGIESPRSWQHALSDYLTQKGHTS